MNYAARDRQTDGWASGQTSKHSATWHDISLLLSALVYELDSDNNYTKLSRGKQLAIRCDSNLVSDSVQILDFFAFGNKNCWWMMWTLWHTGIPVLVGLLEMLLHGTESGNAQTFFVWQTNGPTRQGTTSTKWLKLQCTCLYTHTRFLVPSVHTPKDSSNRRF